MTMEPRMNTHHTPKGRRPRQHRATDRALAAPSVIALLFAALSAGVVLAPHPAAADDKKVEAPRPSLTVTTTRPQKTSLPIRLTANGNVAAWQEAIISSESNGLRLAEVYVNVGDVVKKGELLALFNADTVNADVAQARAALVEAQAAAAEARSNAERARSIESTGALSAQQISQYMTAEATANARIASMRTRGCSSITRRARSSSVFLTRSRQKLRTRVPAARIFPSFDCKTFSRSCGLATSID